MCFGANVFVVIVVAVVAVVVVAAVGGVVAVVLYTQQLGPNKSSPKKFRTKKKSLNRERTYHLHLRPFA